MHCTWRSSLPSVKLLPSELTLLFERFKDDWRDLATRALTSEEGRGWKNTTKRQRRARPLTTLKAADDRIILWAQTEQIEEDCARLTLLPILIHHQCALLVRAQTFTH